MATSSDLSPDASKKFRPGSSSLKSHTSGSVKGSNAENIRKTSRPTSAGPTVTSSAPSSTTPTSNLPSVLISDTSSTSFPSRVVGWKTSHSFSQTMSSLEMPAAAQRSNSGSSSQRPAAIRIQMMEPVGPSAYSLSLQAQRTPSEQWKMLKNRLLRKKSSEESISPELIEKIKQSIRNPQEEGIVCRTNELKRLLKGSETTSDASETRTRISNQSSIDESEDKGPEARDVDMKSGNSSDNEANNDDTDAGTASSKVKWDDSNTLDASVLGDAIEAFLKGLKTSSSPSRTTEKRVSFR